MVRTPWQFFLTIAVLPFLLTFTSPALASAGPVDMTDSFIGYFLLLVFAIAYILVMFEERLDLRKSKPVLVAAGIIWISIGMVYRDAGGGAEVETAFRHTLLEYAELMLFLLVAMTYINALDERGMFDALRAWMIRKRFSYQSLFWITGALAFVISPIADNLTTALLMCAVILKVGEGNKGFINVACVNVVVAANAGGAFSPFGDITTLMVWQAGQVAFIEFFALFIPSLINFLVPAVIMAYFVPKAEPAASNETFVMRRGAYRIGLLFLATVATAVSCHTFLHLPPVLGMMMGLGYLQFFGYFLRKTLPASLEKKRQRAQRAGDEDALIRLGSVVPFDVFNRVARAEWDTLLFFYGIVICVGGLGFMGYLSLMSEALYGNMDATMTNVLLGMISAVIDNIPVMFAVLSMDPAMSHGHWLLITLTAGVGGSLLSIGSAAGVALMGQARGNYTFMGHLRWTPVIFLGYVASIMAHLWLNADSFLIN